jgi:hypothetical protein
MPCQAPKGQEASVRSVSVKTILSKGLGALAVIAVAGAGESAIAQSTNVPPPQSVSSLPQGWLRAAIREDTPEEREAFLKKRELSRVGPVPTQVAPLPQQAINPVAPQRP